MTRGYLVMPQVQIRTASPEDEPVLLGLWSGLVAYHKTIEHVRPERWSGRHGSSHRRLLTHAWEHPDQEVILLAEIEGEAVGFVRVAVTESGPCRGRIETLFVAEDARGRGIGSAMLEAACTWCRAHEANEVCVEFIAPNSEARAFYESRGFQPLLITHMRRL